MSHLRRDRGGFGALGFVSDNTLKELPMLYNGIVNAMIDGRGSHKPLPLRNLNLHAI
jgi:hypothetical protein